MVKVFKSLKSITEDMLSLVYPKVCFGCERNEVMSDNIFCFECASEILPTDQFSVRDNILEQKLQGRVPLEFGAALYFFSKKGRVQNAIHSLKYRKSHEIGIILGRQFGQQMLEHLPQEYFPDLIVPIPVTEQKRKMRGYNQAEMFANGISQVIKRDVADNLLKKSVSTASQTEMSRTERFKNVLESFYLNPRDQKPEQKHILLVDDVFTTGATIEAAAIRLLEIKNIKISIGIIGVGL